MVKAMTVERPRGATARALVGDAFAGVLLTGGGQTATLPGLPGHELLTAHSELLETVRARVIEHEVHLVFLWPAPTGAPGPAGPPGPPGPTHVRVTYLALAEPPLRDELRGSVLLSPAGTARGLTAREFEVLGMMVDGHSNRRIAGEFQVAPRTIATHVEHILAKLSSPTRTHAAVQAQRAGLYVPLPWRPSPND